MGVIICVKKEKNSDRQGKERHIIELTFVSWLLVIPF